jgi:Arc/MetJ-type ribon-helix-helix transcriptional regulator
LPSNYGGGFAKILPDGTAAADALKRCKVSIVLNPDLENRIAAKVRSGRYNSPVEVIQEGLDLLEARDAVPQIAIAQDETPIWETIVGIGMKVPEEEWKQVPADLARNLDHYLYGSPKPSE